jgi:multicomponent K+:H+ antiporter subunit E
MIRKVLPHPLLTLLLTFVWTLLVNKVTLGNLVLGFGLGVIIPLLTAPFWPDRPRIGRPLKVIEYILIVMWDIVVANIKVALIVIFRPNDQIQSGYVTIPLSVTSAEAITVLAGTITLTPGTVSADISRCGHVLLVHCLDVTDPESIRDEIKQRYERRLLEIFK